MKKMLIIICILITIVSVKVSAQDNIEKVIEGQTEAIDIDKLDSVINKLISPESNEVIPKFDIRKSIKDLSMGNASFDIKKIINGILQYLFKEIYSNFDIIVKIIILTLLFALLQNLKSAFGKDSVGEIAFYASYILLAAILIKNFIGALDMGKIVVFNLVTFMQVFIPIIFGLLLATGNVSTVTVMQPSLIFSIGVISTLIKTVILPLILFYTVLSIVNNISSKVHISKIAGFIKNIGTWLMTISLTIFIFILSLQSSITAVADGIGTRTAKFAVSTFVPIVGKLLANTVETVVGGAIVLKNSFSIIGMLAIVLISLAPVIKMFALVIIYKLSAVMIEPISDERIVKSISQMANSLIFLAAAVVTVAVMFIICITILVNAGNTATMLR